MKQRFEKILLFCATGFVWILVACAAAPDTVVKGKEGDERGHEEPVRSCKHAACVNLNSLYAKDAEHVYLDSNDFKGVIPGADPKTFVLLKPSDESAYAKDAKTVYFFGEPVPNADPASFVEVNERYGKDASHVFVMKKIIPEADVATFSAPYPANVWYAKDKKRVYESGKIIPRADPKTFEVVSPDRSCGDGCFYRAQDKNHKYDLKNAVVKDRSKKK